MLRGTRWMELLEEPRQSSAVHKAVFRCPLKSLDTLSSSSGVIEGLLDRCRIFILPCSWKFWTALRWSCEKVELCGVLDDNFVVYAWWTWFCCTRLHSLSFDDQRTLKYWRSGTFSLFCGAESFRFYIPLKKGEWRTTTLENTRLFEKFYKLFFGWENVSGTFETPFPAGLQHMPNSKPS